jgi:pyruvate kinase
MLESMVTSRIPTRAEATDVANAILDGTDAVMLSAESAVGRFPEEAVAMLGRIAAETERAEPSARQHGVREFSRTHRPGSAAEAMATVVEHALDTVPCEGVFVPTRTGTTARMLARYKPAAWVIAVSERREVCQGLVFSYGVRPEQIAQDPEDWEAFARSWMRDHGVPGRTAMLVAGPSQAHPEARHRIEFMRLGG